MEPALLSSEMESYKVGSGVRVEPGSREYSRCASCGSEDTLRIYSKFRYTSSDTRSENYYWRTCEFVCNECDQFTYYEAYWES